MTGVDQLQTPRWGELPDDQRREAAARELAA